VIMVVLEDVVVIVVLVDHVATEAEEVRAAIDPEVTAAGEATEAEEAEEVVAVAGASAETARRTKARSLGSPPPSLVVL